MRELSGRQAATSAWAVVKRRWRSSRTCTALAWPLVLFAGCASVDPEADFERARELIRSSTGRAEVFEPDEPALPSSEIEAILDGGLELDEALRLALLNNRRLQAQFMTLGIARADLVQAGLLSNPSLSLLFLLPSGGGRANVQASLAQSVSDLWQIPARKRVARADLEVRLLQVSRFAGLLVADTRQAYFESVAARDTIAVARENSAIARRGIRAVGARVREGVATQVEESLAQGLALNADLDLRRAECDETAAKRRLGALLSVSQDLFEVELIDPLPDPAPRALAYEELVELALRSRLDLQALNEAVRAAEAQVAFERKRILPDASLALQSERPEGSGSDLLGPGASVTLPIFDQNQARIARAGYRQLELQRTYEALAFEIGQGVRAAADRALLAARTAVFVRDELLPQARRSADFARRAYDLGDVTSLALLEAERTVLQARRSDLDARFEAAQAWNELERAAGSPIDPLRVVSDGPQ